MTQPGKNEDMPEFDYDRVDTLYMAGSHVLNIILGSYKEFQIEGKKETFLAKQDSIFVSGMWVDSRRTLVGSTDDIIAMGFKDKDSTV